jgi:hypothetical protein
MGSKRKAAEMNVGGNDNVAQLQEDVNTQIPKLMTVLRMSADSPEVQCAVLECLYRICGTAAGRTAVLTPDVIVALAEVVAARDSQVAQGLQGLWGAAVAERYPLAAQVHSVCMQDGRGPWVAAAGMITA